MKMCFTPHRISPQGIALIMLLAATAVYAQPASNAPPPDTMAPPSTGRVPNIGDAIPTERPKPPPLPLNFSEFAADYKPKGLRQQWLTVDVGTLEIAAAPPDNQGMFMLATLPQASADNFRPIRMSCLFGAKSRFENVTVLDHDPAGHALGYAFPLGKLAYFVARDDTPNGVDFSLYFYDASALQWSPSPIDRGAYAPATAVVAKPLDLTAPTERYIFTYLYSRVGPPTPGSTARQVMLYTYLVLYMHRVEPLAPITGTPAAQENSGGGLVTPVPADTHP